MLCKLCSPMYSRPCTSKQNKIVNNTGINCTCYPTRKCMLLLTGLGRVSIVIIVTVFHSQIASSILTNTIRPSRTDRPWARRLRAHTHRWCIEMYSGTAIVLSSPLVTERFKRSPDSIFHWSGWNVIELRRRWFLAFDSRDERDWSLVWKG